MTKVFNLSKILKFEDFFFAHQLWKWENETKFWKILKNWKNFKIYRYYPLILKLDEKTNTIFKYYMTLSLELWAFNENATQMRHKFIGNAFICRKARIGFHNIFYLMIFSIFSIWEINKYELHVTGSLLIFNFIEKF